MLRGFQAKGVRVLHPTNEPYKLRYKWRSLTQHFGRLKEYISKYRGIMLQITTTDDFDKSHGFLFGLQPSMRKKVDKLEPASLEVLEFETIGVETRTTSMFKRSPS